MKINYGSASTILVAVGAACWFGLQLGPREAKRAATPESATLAAQSFVRTMVRKRAGNDPVTFSGINGDWRGTSQDASDPDLWTVEGLATAGTADLRWTVTERWDGVSEWRAKSVEVVGPKR